MKILYVGAGVLVTGLIIYFGFIYESCKKPDNLTVAVKGLNCAIEVLDRPIEEIREEACTYIGKGPGCSFDEGDRDKVRKFIDDKVNTCVKKRLKEDNFCTDNLPEVSL